MDPLSITSIAVSGISSIANALRPRVLKRLGSEPDTSLKVLRTCLLPQVDIVCIPDINENPLTAWTTKGKANKVNWLTDLLPGSLPEARILLFSWSLKTRTAEGFTRSDIFSQAFDLLEHLWLRRRGLAERRPIIFLVHNSGVLIARSALIQASAAITDRDYHLRSIYQSTGVVFIIDAQEELSKSWQEVLDKAREKIPHPVVKNASSDRQSAEWFKWQQDRFRAIATSISTVAVSVATGLKSRNEVGQKLLDAAAMYKNMKFLGSDARIKQLRRHRPDLMVYESAEDEDYKTLLGHLQHSIEIGASSAKAKWDISTLHKSLTSSTNESWVKEAEIEYEGQLEDTSDATTKRHDEIEAVYNQLEDHVDASEYSRAPSRVSMASVTSSPQSPHSDAWHRARIKQVNVEREILRQIEEDYGFMHARTLEGLDSLASEYIELEMLDTAESIVQRLLVSWANIFGMRNKRVLHAIQQIALIKTKQGRYADAALYLAKAIELRYGLLKDLERSKVISSKTSAVNEQATSPQSLAEKIKEEQEAIAKCQIDLAVAYDMQARFEEAELIYTQILRTRKDQTDACRLLALENQALHWRKRGNLSAAADTYQAILDAFEKKKPAPGRRERKLVEDKLREVNDVLSKKKSTNSYF